jgi:hypothetical protein
VAPNVRAGVIYLGLAIGGIYLLVTGNLGKLQRQLTGAVTGAAVQQPLQGPSWLRGSTSAVINAGARGTPGGLGQ